MAENLGRLRGEKKKREQGSLHFLLYKRMHPRILVDVHKPDIRHKAWTARKISGDRMRKENDYL